MKKILISRKPAGCGQNNTNLHLGSISFILFNIWAIYRTRMVFYHSRKWEKKIKILMIFAYLSWFFLSGRKPAGGGNKQYRLSILIIKNHHLQYWSCKFILSWHFSLFKVREKQPNLMKNGPPWRNFLDGRVPAGGGTKVYKLSILRNVVHLVHYWGHLYILDHFFSLLKIKKNAKNAKNGPPPKLGYTEKYLKW